MRRSGVLVLAACFFLSGMGSLALEVVWTRELRLVFGATTLAASTILVAYMLGLGVGGLLGGRLATRFGNGVRAYGWIEIAIGAYALAVPGLLAQLPWLNRTLLAGMDFWPAVLCRFAIVLALLLVPTVLMGATLPILVAAVVRGDQRVGASTGLLYGLNTLGAVAGVFGATFVLFPTLGLTWTNRFGALLDVAVGLVALLWLAPRFAAAAVPRVAQAAPPRGTVATGRRRVLLVVYALVGFTALLYEVAWMRGLATTLGSSIYAFSSMLGAFLTGIALGSLVFRRWIDASRSPYVLLAAGIGALAVLALGTTALVPHLPALLLRIVEWGGVDTRLLTATQVVLCMLVMLPPTLVLGGLFPLVARCLAEDMEDVGEAVGRVYFANTLGSAAGAFVTGFVLLPALGLRETLALGAGIDLVAVAIVLLLATGAPALRRWAILPTAAAVLLLVVPIPFDRAALTRGVFKAPEVELEWDIELDPVDGHVGKELMFYRDGLNATVSVHREDGVVAMRVNGKVDASNSGDMTTQVLLGQVPLLFGPPAKKVLVIGYASGVTVGSVARHPDVERIDAVEIEPAILEASRYFDRESGRPLDDPRVTLVLDDARSYLAATDETYDIVISQPSNPWMTGVSNLFTREFFRIVRERLAPGGRLLQWMQLYALDPRSLSTIVAALRSEFPHVYGFADFSGGPDVFFLAMDRPLARDDLPRWEELPESVRADLERVGSFSSADLWSMLRVTPADIDAFAAGAPLVNTDDNLFIELSSPWTLYGDTFAENWDAMVTRKGVVVPWLEELGEPLDADAVGELAYAHAKKQPDAVTPLVRAAGARGGSGSARAAEMAALRAHGGTATLAQQRAALDEAVAASPGSFLVHLLRGEVRDESGDRAGALADAERAVELRPDDPRARTLRMRMLAQTGRLPEARAEADRLLGTPYGQWNVDLQRDAAEILRLTGDLPRALALFEILLKERDATWTEGWPLLARAYSQLGNHEASIRAYESGRNARRNQAKRLHRMARTALWRGRPDEARRILQVAVSVDPEYRPARHELDALPG